MLIRQTLSTGLAYYASPALQRLGVRHGFSTRLGGVSTGPFASLNFGSPNGYGEDRPDHLAENHRRFLSAIGCADAELIRLNQVHADRVVEAHQARQSCQGDGLVSDDPRIAISIRTADCVPVLMSAADGRTVAAIHAGWRGVVAGIVPRTVQTLRAKAQGQPITAAIGPCIGHDAFEVGPEVLQQFETYFGPDAPLRRRPDGKGYVDLRQAIHRQLQAAGLAPDAIDSTDRCTVRHADEFFSHRRDHGLTGRMIAVIVARP